MLEIIAQPDDGFRLGDFLIEGFQNNNWTEFRAAVAFVKRSGTKHIATALAQFNQRANVNISVGIDTGGTSVEGLTDLINALENRGRIYVFKNNGPSTFHPKIFLFKNDLSADLIVGSGNLTEGGLFTNYEANLRIQLDLSDATHSDFLATVELALNRWSMPVEGLCHQLDIDLLALLHASGDIPTEAYARDVSSESNTRLHVAASQPTPFAYFPIQRAPAATRVQAVSITPPAMPNMPAILVAGLVQPNISAPQITTASIRFGMTLQTTHVGVGQTSANTVTQRRSPEVFIPMAALDMNPNFWGWPNKYVADHVWATKPTNARWITAQSARPAKPNRPLAKMDWYNVKIHLVGHANLLDATIWHNPKKTDIRIRQEIIRSAGHVGDILLIQQAPPNSNYDYVIEIVHQLDPRFAALAIIVAVPVRNSLKKIGYF